MLTSTQEGEDSRRVFNRRRSYFDRIRVKEASENPRLPRFVARFEGLPSAPGKVLSSHHFYKKGRRVVPGRRKKKKRPTSGARVKNSFKVRDRGGGKAVVRARKEGATNNLKKKKKKTKQVKTFSSHIGESLRQKSAFRRGYRASERKKENRRTDLLKRSGLEKRNRHLPDGGRADSTKKKSYLPLHGGKGRSRQRKEDHSRHRKKDWRPFFVSFGKRGLHNLEGDDVPEKSKKKGSATDPSRGPPKRGGVSSTRKNSY